MITNGQTVNYLPQNIPTIVAQPSGLAISNGQTAVFSATVDNASAFQWLLNGQPLTNGPLMSGLQSNSVTVADAQFTNAGGYTLIVSNSSGSATSAVATLTVLGAPVSFNPSTLHYGNGKFIAQITGLTGQGLVVIDASTNLIQWTPVFTNPSAVGTISFTDSNAASYPRRFYRAVAPP